MKAKYLLLILPVFWLMVSCDSGSSTSSTPETTEEHTSETAIDPGPTEGANSPETETEELEAEVDTREEMSLEEWANGKEYIFDRAELDFNEDGKMDLVVILKAPDEDNVDYSEEYRTLLVLESRGDDAYVLAGRGETCVMCKDCGGMMGEPVQPLDFQSNKAGQFTISHAGGSREKWGWDHVYAYNKADGKIYLVEKISSTYDSMNPDAGEADEVEAIEMGTVPLEDVEV